MENSNNTEKIPVETEESVPEPIPITEKPEQPELIPAPEPTPVTVDELINRTEKRKPGRPKGSTKKNLLDGGISVLPESAQPPPNPPPTAENIPQVNYALLSETFFDTGTGALAVAFGPEWHPRTPDERQAVCGALSNYLRAKEVKDIPPGAMLTIVLLAYSAPRLKEPATSGKIKMGILWIKNKLSRKKTLRPQ